MTNTNTNTKIILCFLCFIGATSVVAQHVVLTKANGGSSWISLSGAGSSGIYSGDGTTPADVDITVMDSINFDDGTFFIDGSNNKVGILNVNPTAPLDIKGVIKIGKGGGSVTNASDILFTAQGLIAAESSLMINIDSDNNATDNYFSVRKNSEVGNVGKELFRVKEDGCVGINTTTPAYKLEVLGAAMLEDVSTVPTASTGHSGIYSSGGELNALDASGNSTVISPHHFSLVQPSEEMAWSFYSRNERIGKEINVDMMRMARIVEELSGEKLVHQAYVNGEKIQNKTHEVSLRETVKIQEEKLVAQEQLINELMKRIEALEK